MQWRVSNYNRLICPHGVNLIFVSLTFHEARDHIQRPARLIEGHNMSSSANNHALEAWNLAHEACYFRIGIFDSPHFLRGGCESGS